MTIRHLRIFKVVCEEMNITKAAERLYMTQPAVSHAISDLESEIGFLLFDRMSRKIYLNEIGKLFLKKVIRILDLYDDLEKGVYDLEKQATIKIGSTITIANFWLPSIMNKFERICNNTPVKVEIYSADGITNKLLNNEIDIALIEGVINHDQFIKIPFSSYKLIAIASPLNSLSLKKTVTLDILIKERLLLREKGSAIRDTFDSMLLLNNILVEPIWTSVNSQALIQAVKHNLGISILPDILVKKEIEKGEVVHIWIEDLDLTNENNIVIHKDKFQSKFIKSFIDLVKQSN